MTENIEKMRQFFVVDKGQKAMWQEPEDPYILAEQFAAEQIPDVDRAGRCADIRRVLAAGNAFRCVPCI